METFKVGPLKDDSSKFLSYLWGMETLQLSCYLLLHDTCSYPTYEEWKHIPHRFVNNFVLFRSYPTYEEWKLSGSPYISATCLACSYPTYEEWKPHFFSIPNTSFFCSYPTYEEWKPPCSSFLSKHNCIVLILPMRNGNSIKHTLPVSFSIVLILPMRNGNKYVQFLDLKLDL